MRKSNSSAEMFYPKNFAVISKHRKNKIGGFQMAKTKDKNNWRQMIAPYEKADTRRSIWQLINTFVPLMVMWYLTYWSLSISYWITLPLAIVTAGILVRIFIIFH